MSHLHACKLLVCSMSKRVMRRIGKCKRCGECCRSIIEWYPSTETIESGLERYELFHGSEVKFDVHGDAWVRHHVTCGHLVGERDGKCSCDVHGSIDLPGLCIAYPSCNEFYRGLKHFADCGYTFLRKRERDHSM